MILPAQLLPFFSMLALNGEDSVSTLSASALDRNTNIQIGPCTTFCTRVGGPIHENCTYGDVSKNGIYRCDAFCQAPLATCLQRRCPTVELSSALTFLGILC